MKVTMQEAKSQLSKLGKLAWKGQKIVIERDGKPYLDLLPHRADPVERKPGRLKGKIVMAPDFDATPEEFSFSPEERIARARALRAALPVTTFKPRDIDAMKREGRRSDR